MGRTEIAVAAWKRFVADTGESMPPESEWNPGFVDNQRPIVRLTWDEAGYFCAWAGGRVPSETEWEYAALSGAESDTGTDVNAVAWYAANSGGKGPLAVAQKQPNAWALFDVLGNVLGVDDGIVSADRKRRRAKCAAAPGQAVLRNTRGRLGRPRKCHRGIGPGKSRGWSSK